MWNLHGRQMTNQLVTTGIVSLFLTIAGIATPQAGNTQTLPTVNSDSTLADWSLLAPYASEWPKLIFDSDSKTCAGYLRAVRAAFVAPSPHPPVSLGIKDWSGAKILFDVGPNGDGSVFSERALAILEAESKGQNNHALLNADVDRDGKEESLLISWTVSSGSGASAQLNSFRISIFASNDKLAIKTAFESGGAVLERHAQRGVQYAAGSQLWNAPIIIETDEGKVYFTRRLGDTSDDENTLYELTKPGFQLDASDVQSNGLASFEFQFRVSSLVKRCTVRKVDRSWMGPATSRLVTHLTGTRGSSCGNEKWPTYAVRPGERSLLLSNFGGRPWALSPPQDDKSTVWKALEAWSLTNPWNRWTYRNIRESFLGSVQETKARLIKTQAVQADEQSLSHLAEEITWRATGAHFVFGSDVSKNLLHNIDPLLKSLYRNEIATEDLASVLETAGKASPNAEHLLAVLDRPDQVAEMLALGAPSDAADVYGKTALMYAAQMGYIETAKQLISAGADINQSKHVLRCTRAEDRLQTALSYALTQATYETIEFLLNSGAKLSPQESKRPEFHWWNLHLTQEQRLKLDEVLNEN